MYLLHQQYGSWTGSKSFHQFMMSSHKEVWRMPSIVEEDLLSTGKSSINHSRGCTPVANAADMHLHCRDLPPERVAFGRQYFQNKCSSSFREENNCPTLDFLTYLHYQLSLHVVKSQAKHFLSEDIILHMESSSCQKKGITQKQSTETNATAHEEEGIRGICDENTCLTVSPSSA